MFVHNSVKVTSLNIDNYCLDQDFEVRAIHLDTVYDKLCILPIYRSPLGNFNTFLTNFDLILHKFFNPKCNFTICGGINVNYLVESYKRNQLKNILHSFNFSSIVNFPTRIGPNSFSSIDNVFIDNSYLNKFDTIPLVNGLSDHDAYLLTIQFVQKHNKDQGTYFKRNINQYTIADFLLNTAMRPGILFLKEMMSI